MANNSFFGLLTGLAAGAVIGLLFAPDKGWKTRERVKRATSQGFSDLKDEMSGWGGKAEEAASNAKEEFSSLRDTIRKQTEGVKESARKKILEQLDRLEKKLTKADGDVDDQTPAE